MRVTAAQWRVYWKVMGDQNLNKPDARQKIRLKKLLHRGPSADKVIAEMYKRAQEQKAGAMKEEAGRTKEDGKSQ